MFHFSVLFSFPLFLSLSLSLFLEKVFLVFAAWTILWGNFYVLVS
jgi:hypothetical protein